MDTIFDTACRLHNLDPEEVEECVPESSKRRKIAPVLIALAEAIYRGDVESKQLPQEMLKGRIYGVEVLLYHAITLVDGEKKSPLWDHAARSYVAGRGIKNKRDKLPVEVTSLLPEKQQKRSRRRDLLSKEIDRTLLELEGTLGRRPSLDEIWNNLAQKAEIRCTPFVEKTSDGNLIWFNAKNQPQDPLTRELLKKRLSRREARLSN